MESHLAQLASIAERLAQQVNRLLRYKDDDDIEAMGDVLGHLKLWRKSNRTIVEEFAYEEQLQVDSYLAKCLFNHYTRRFGELPFEKWNELSTLNITGEIFDNLKLLAHADLKPCPNCPICKDITG